MKRAKELPPGIVAGSLYTAAEFCRLMRWGRKAFVSARKRGLPVHKESRFLYVLGDEVIAWMRNRSKPGQ